MLLHHDHQPEPLRTGRLRTGWQNVINRSVRTGEKDYSQTLTFDEGIDFIERNIDGGDWFLQIEAFDPHEPFDAPDRFLSQWFDPDHLCTYDWPPYAKVDETQEEIEQIRKKYYALVQFCDASLGRVLDIMEQYHMWENTMLIVNTDHGFSLAEHNWWGKNYVPDYQEIAHIPLFIWDPRYGVRGECRNELVQTIDIAPTILDFFGMPIPETMDGKPLGTVIKECKAVRKYAIFGMFGSAINITDGRYVYMRAVRTPDEKLMEYTLMPTHLNGFFSAEEMKNAKLSSALPFTKGYPVLMIPSKARRGADKLDSDLLFDLDDDPKQEHPIVNKEIEERMIKALRKLLAENDAPCLLYERFGLQDANG